MDRETASHVGHIAQWLVDHWQLVAFAVGGLLGSIWWALHRVFTTHATMYKCRDELISALEKHQSYEDRRLSELKNVNAEQHQEIREDVRWIKNHLIEKNGK